MSEKKEGYYGTPYSEHEQNARGYLKMALDIDTNNLAITLEMCVWKTEKRNIVNH